MRAILIPVDLHEPIRDIDIDGSLESLQKIVGGYIEYIPTHNWESVAVYINEEGKLDNLPENLRATIILGDGLFPGDYIAGPCLVTGHDGHGEMADLPADFTIGSLTLRLP